MRLDKYLSERSFSSRTKAARAIAEGRVTVNGKRAQASDEVGEGDDVRVLEVFSYVSEGGKKLERALEAFGENVKGLVCADFGASTGGFTDCLLRAGAARVYALDVGESQLDAHIAGDPRVTVLDNTNVRYLQKGDLPEAPSLITIDVSFISLTLVLPVAAAILEEGGRVLALVKPQFECGGKKLDKHGVLKDAALRAQIVQSVVRFAEGLGLRAYGVVNAPLRPRKNVEYMVGFAKGGCGGLSVEEVRRLAERLV